MRIDNPYLVGKMLKSISPDSVRSGRTCPANLGVRSCPVRKLICPVRSSPNLGLLVLLESFRKREGHTGQNLRYIIIPENLKILVSHYVN